MRITFNIEKLIPRFILADKNGYALAKAIERAFRIVAEATQQGIDIVLDPDKMPEWRLDEMAWELNCLYDYAADVEAKRKWIKNARRMNRILGTPDGVTQYLAGYFDRVILLENWEYGGSPFHFKVDLYGQWSQKKQDWTLAAIEAAKNTRSVLDSATFHQPEVAGDQTLFAAVALYGAKTQSFAAMDAFDPDDEAWLTDENGDYLTDENGVAMTE